MRGEFGVVPGAIALRVEFEGDVPRALQCCLAGSTDAANADRALPPRIGTQALSPLGHLDRAGSGELTVDLRAALPVGGMTESSTRAVYVDPVSGRRTTYDEDSVLEFRRAG